MPTLGYQVFGECLFITVLWRCISYIKTWVLKCDSPDESPVKARETYRARRQSPHQSQLSRVTISLFKEPLSSQHPSEKFFGQHWIFKKAGKSHGFNNHEKKEHWVSVEEFWRSCKKRWTWFWVPSQRTQPQCGNSSLVFQHSCSVWARGRWKCDWHISWYD